MPPLTTFCPGSPLRTDSPPARFAAATLLAIPAEVRQALRDAVAGALEIPIDDYGPDADAVDPSKQAAYNSDVDDLFDCWVRKHVLRLQRRPAVPSGAEDAPVVTPSGSWSPGSASPSEATTKVGIATPPGRDAGAATGDDGSP